MTTTSIPDLLAAAGLWPAGLAETLDADPELVTVADVDQYAHLFAAAWGDDATEMRDAVAAVMVCRLAAAVNGDPVDVDGSTVVIDVTTPTGQRFLQHHRWVAEGCADEALAARFTAAAGLRGA